MSNGGKLDWAFGAVASVILEIYIPRLCILRSPGPGTWGAGEPTCGLTSLPGEPD